MTVTLDGNELFIGPIVRFNQMSVYMKALQRNFTEHLYANAAHSNVKHNRSTMSASHQA